MGIGCWIDPDSGVLNVGSAGILDANGSPLDLSGTGTAVGGLAAGYKIARGVHTTVAASDTVVTGLATVVAIIVSPQADLSVDLMGVTATIGDQAGTPAAGSVIIKTWKPTTGGIAGNPTPVAATTFSKAINWIAIGT